MLKTSFNWKEATTFFFEKKSLSKRKQYSFLYLLYGKLFSYIFSSEVLVFVFWKVFNYMKCMWRYQYIRTMTYTTSAKHLIFYSHGSQPF